ncbi:GPW/gp25 family protein [Dactylosporangium sp. NPDC051541]|uniref:GPW/gp25 family protein n=1 Tax=Dactylosporangium sp. NPDC051541 TaxID=3363977 RepID=UPI0037A60747
MATTLRFPFSANSAGAIAVELDEDAQLRGKVIQVLFTAPGERVNQPEFGCGLFNLAFDPNNTIMAAATEFSIGQALSRWLGDELVVGAVGVRSLDEQVAVEVAYVRRKDLSRQAVRVQFK